MTFEKILPWIVAPLVPVAIVLGVVRFLLTPVFIQVEYRLPGFPPDAYGFTTADRLYWADLSRQYLLNDADISFLAERKLPDGSPLYNARELRHMEDVKRVVQGSLRVWEVALAALLLLGMAAYRWNAWEAFRRGLAWGGWLTVGLMLAIVALTIVAFQTLFVDFHKVFFEGDTWLFSYKDTLIRLFPERFWRDAFMLVGGLSLLLGRAVAMLGRKA
ncbi:MAG: TIGR01906 family membrane protein [Chloroflexi bacterium]|nr:TIGR01906 family membrane protein [Chloroflexota bacterium]